MTYEEALFYIHSTPKFSRVLGNDMLRKLLHEMNDPQKHLKFIHIAGTNGKGSTAKMLSYILTLSGYKTGLFISPFIERFNERISIDGSDIPDRELARITTNIRNIIDTKRTDVSEFALDTAIAFQYFFENKCDIVVLETGLGGRLDATNVIDSHIASVFTKIGLDHMQYLGDTVEQITAEKCGIMRQNSISIISPCQQKEVINVIHQYAKMHNNTLIFADTPVLCENGFIYKGKHYTLNLHGTYQPENAATVLETVNVLNDSGFNITEDTVKAAFTSVTWKARYEFIRKNIIIDGGHNIDGITALKKSLEKENKKILIFAAMMEDKAWKECLKEILPIAAYVGICELNMPRCLKKENIKSICNELNIPSISFDTVKDAVKYSLTIPDDILCCFCGSLYFAGEARSEFNKLNQKL